MTYGDKRDYPKIDLYVDSTYVASTTWSRTCKEAVQRFLDGKEAQLLWTGRVIAHKAK